MAKITLDNVTIEGLSTEDTAARQLATEAKNLAQKAKDMFGPVNGIEIVTQKVWDGIPNKTNNGILYLVVN